MSRTLDEDGRRTETVRRFFSPAARLQVPGLTGLRALAAFLVVPTFALVYLLGAPIGLRTRLAHLSAAGALLAVVSLSWAVVVDLTPADRRPYVGGSTRNSALELALGYNGLGRVLGGSGNFGGPPGMGGGMGPGIGAFPPGVEIRRLGLAEAVANTRAFLSPSNSDSESEFSRESIIE